jgi:hypothetical protein
VEHVSSPKEGLLWEVAVTSGLRVEAFTSRSLILLLKLLIPRHAGREAKEPSSGRGEAVSSQDGEEAVEEDDSLISASDQM